MSRWWTEHAANIFEPVGHFFSGLFRALGNLLGHLLAMVPWTYALLGALAVLVLWLIYRVVRSRVGRPKRSKKAKKSKKPKAEDDNAAEDNEEEPTEEPEQVPDLPSVVFASLADRYAAEGRFAEAIRERLRAMVKRMVESGVISNIPGATVTELAAEAALAQPAVGPAVYEASRIFSDVWYGEREALAAHDNRMRELSRLVEARAVARELVTR